MKRWNGLVVAGAILLLAGSASAGRPENPGNGNGGGNGGGPAACDPVAVDAAAAAVAAACPCAGRTDDTGAVVPWKNHGQYVRCVAKANKAAIAAFAVSRRCLKSSQRCAARSTCGRAEGFVNCTTTTSSTCVAGACADGSACAADADCTESSCSFRPSADACIASGGTPGTGSCCAPEPIVPPGSPSGAFLDRGAAF